MPAPFGIGLAGFSEWQAALSPVESGFGVFPKLWDQALGVFRAVRLQLFT
jgi:hypothetical protein